MNTETKVHEHDMEKYDTYRKAYNAGKSDAILEFVEMVKKDIGAFVGEDDEFVKDVQVRLYKILDDRKAEVINEGQSQIEIGCYSCPNVGHIEKPDCDSAYTPNARYCNLYNHNPYNGRI